MRQGPRLRHPRAARLADPGRRLHRRPHHARPDGHPHRPPVQRGRRLPDHGRQQPRAAPAVAARRGHLQRHGRHDRRQQPVPGGLAAGPGAGDLSGEGPGQGGQRGSPKSEVRSPKSGVDGGPRYPGPIVFEGNAPADVRENPVLRRLARRPSRSSRPRPAASGWARPTRSRGRPRRCSTGKAATTCCWSASAKRRCWPSCRSGSSPWPPSIPLGDGALHPVRRHRARARPQREYHRARPPGHPAPDHAGQAGRPGRHHAGAWPAR